MPRRQLLFCRGAIAACCGTACFRGSGSSDRSHHAHDLSEFTFGLLAIFRRYVGDELTMKLVAQVKGASDIDDLRLPFLVKTPGLRNG